MIDTTLLTECLALRDELDREIAEVVGDLEIQKRELDREIKTLKEPFKARIKEIEDLEAEVRDRLRADYLAQHELRRQLLLEGVECPPIETPGYDVRWIEGIEVDEETLPREYFAPDMRRIKAAMPPGATAVQIPVFARKRA